MAIEVGLGSAWCPLCGRTMRPEQIVCRSCWELTDGLQPGIYSEGTVRRLDPIYGNIELTQKTIGEWIDRRNFRVERRKVGSLLKTLRERVGRLDDIEQLVERSLSESFASYFDASDALATIAKELELLKSDGWSSLEPVDEGDDGSTLRVRPVARAIDSLERELDSLFASLSKLSSRLDGLRGED